MKFSFADILSNLHVEYEQLKVEGGNVTTARVAVTYCSEEKYESSSIKQTAQTAMQLPRSVVRLLREIASLEYLVV